MCDFIRIKLNQLFVASGVVEDIARVHALAIDFDLWRHLPHMSISQAVMLSTCVYVCVCVCEW